MKTYNTANGDAVAEAARLGERPVLGTCNPQQMITNRDSSLV